MRNLAALTGMVWLLSVSACYAGYGGADSNGGSGLPGKNGQRGMAGCPGGTPRSTDGHFYLPGTQERCNPPSAKKHHWSPQRSVESV
ncbi:hypothetical protein C7420_102200 [Pantoea ananatis]|nr:hypothetical protein C7420_102200 [Pantoea ananatis]